MKAKEFVVRTWTMAQPVANLLGATCMRKKDKAKKDAKKEAKKDGEDPADVLNVVEMKLSVSN